MISEVTLKAAVPEIGLIMAKGAISAGKPILDKNGCINCTKASKAPELLRIAIATNIPNKKGRRETDSLRPSFPPSTNTSYAGTPLIMAISNMVMTVIGTNHILIVVIHSIIVYAPFYTCKDDLL